jgi:hypothetical protein
LGTVTSFNFTGRSDGLWYFHMRTRDNAGNWSETVHAGPYGIDTQPPAAPTFAYSDPEEDTWSNDETVYVHWYHDDVGGSPIEGYSYKWSTWAGDHPDIFVDSEWEEAGSAALDSDIWYLHVIAIDEANNLGDRATFGPFKIDTERPPLPADLDSSTHEVMEETSVDVVSVSWSEVVDPGGSGVAGYSYVWREGSSTTMPDDVVDTTATSVTSAALPEGDWYFLVRTVDRAGNGSLYGASQIGPFKIRPPALDVGFAGGVDDPWPGQALEYEVIVGNSGSVAALGAELGVILSSDLDFVACTSGCTHSDGVVTWDLGTLDPGELHTLELDVAVDGAANQGAPVALTGILQDSYGNLASAITQAYVRIPECPRVRTRIADATHGETVYTVIPYEGSAHVSYVPVQVRLSTPDLAGAHGISVTVEVPGNILGYPTSVRSRNGSGSSEDDLTWSILDGGRYQTMVDLAYDPAHGDYRQQVIFMFQVTAYATPRTLRFGVEVESLWEFCQEKHVETEIVEGVDAVVVTSRHHLYDQYDEDEVELLLEEVFATVNGKDGQPRGAVYYMDLYDEGMLEWDNTDIDWTSEDTVNEVSDDVVNWLISLWYRDATEYIQIPIPSFDDIEISLGPGYLLIVGDDNVVPYYRAPDPYDSDSEDDHVDGPGPVRREAQRHNYIFSDAYYAAPTWTLTILPDWIHGESLWAVGRIVGATAEDVRSFVSNSRQGPSARSNTVIAASYDGFDLDENHPALERVRSWGFDIHNDDEIPETVENDGWYTGTLYSLMRQGFVGMYYAGHGYPLGITSPLTSQLGVNDAYITAGDLPSLAGSFSADRPFFLFNSCRVGQSYGTFGWEKSFIYSLVHNDMSAAIAAGGISRYYINYGVSGAGEELSERMMINLFDSDSPRSFGDALMIARQEYDEGSSWDIDDSKTQIEFMLFGLPWGYVPQAAGGGLQMAATSAAAAAPAAAGSAQLSLLQQEATTAITDTVTVVLTATLDTSSYHIDTTTAPGYDLLRVDGFGLLKDMELPVLPVRHLTFTLPLQAQIVDASASITDPVLLTGLDVPMWVPFTPSAEKATMVLSDTADWVGTWPTRTVVARQRLHDGHRIGHVWVIPAVYDAVSDQATLYQQVHLTVTYQISRALAMPRFFVKPVNTSGDPILARGVVANASGITRTVFPVLSVLERGGSRVGWTAGELVTVPPGQAAAVQMEWTHPLTEGTYIAVLSMVRGGQVWAWRAQRFAVRGGEIRYFGGPEIADVGETLIYTITLKNNRAISMTAQVSLLARDAEGIGRTHLMTRTITLEGGTERTLPLPLRVMAGWRDVLVQAQVEVDGHTVDSPSISLLVRRRVYLPLILRQ